MKPRHSILVITYNQEKFIGDCLDSILSQSVSPYEVIIIDDCSVDDTWSVVNKYAENHPEIVKASRNLKNIGVFKNFNKIKKMPTGDFVNFVSGDDILPEGILDQYNYYIEQNKLVSTTPFIIHTNSGILTKTGSIIKKDNYCNRGVNTIDLTLLCSFYVWDTGMSIELVRAMPSIREDIGYQADWLQHFQRLLICGSNQYFLNKVGYIYRLGVGVTVATTAKKQIESKLAVINIFEEEYRDFLSLKVAKYFVFEKSYFKYIANPTFSSYMSMLKNRILTGMLPKNSSFRSTYKYLIPIKLKSMAKRILF